MALDKHSLYTGIGIGAFCGAVAIGLLTLRDDPALEARLIQMESAVKVVGGESYDVPGMREALARGVDELMKSNNQVEVLRRRVDTLESAMRQQTAQYAAHLKQSDSSFADIRRAAEKAVAEKVAASRAFAPGTTVEGLILKSVAKAWVPPKELTDAMTAVLDISVASNGAFTNAATVTSSGDVEFDNSVIQAFKTAGGVAELSRLSPQQKALLNPYRMTISSSSLSAK